VDEDSGISGDAVPHPAPDSVAILTLNLRSIRDFWVRREPLAVAQIRVASPDICALQEVSSWSFQGAWLRCRLNRGQTPDMRYRHWHSSDRGLTGVIEGESILTRVRVVERAVLYFGIDNRIAQRATLVLPTGKAFNFVNTHLADGYKESDRMKQAEMLLEWLSTSRLPTVVAGDLNARPESAVIATLKSRFRSAHEVKHGHEPDRTMPPRPVAAGEWSATYDYVLISDDIVVDECEVACGQPSTAGSRFYPSDHLGVLARLRIL
jgi:endonuclease/exonuclease/phosphatase family metal-dependent hydrolase